MLRSVAINALVGSNQSRHNFVNEREIAESLIERDSSHLKSGLAHCGRVTAYLEIAEE